MVRAAALLLAVLYTTVLGGLKHFREKADFPIGPFVQNSSPSKYREMRLETECVELFSRYPDTDGWMENVYCGDIPFLADADYIDQCVKNGCEFWVKTPEQLASFCWFVNTQSNKYPQTMYLEADIDLSGHEWAPMGWSDGIAETDDHPFRGYVNGGGHTIKNMSVQLKGAGSCAGFIGWSTGGAAVNIAFDGASVSGGFAGVVTGEAIGGGYENITVTNSTVDGSYAGSMLGWDANAQKKNCMAQVIVNGEEFNFLSYNDKEKSGIVIENPVEITIDENYVAVRPEVEGYSVFSWVVKRDGRQIYCNSALGSYTYDCPSAGAGQYEVYLQAFVSGQYVPISNIVSYTIE